MSRVGKSPIAVPSGVSVEIKDGSIEVKGPHGSLHFSVPAGILIEMDNTTILIKRCDDSRDSRAKHGLVRALVSNMVAGVVKPFEKKLEIQGVGYQAAVSSGKLTLNVGFANPVVLALPDGIKCTLSDPTHLTVSGVDKRAVGQFAADVRSARPPEPYKGKGIRYSGEYVRRKAGKAFGAK